jgi:hypothetical protein
MDCAFGHRCRFLGKLLAQKASPWHRFEQPFPGDIRRLELVHEVRSVDAVALRCVIWIEAAAEIVVNTKHVSADHGDIVRQAGLPDAV